MANKYKWKVSEKPTGRYASFQSRSWPSLYTNNDGDFLLAQIVSGSGMSYSASNGRREDLDLIVRVYDYSSGVVDRSMSVSKQKFSSMNSAKSLAEKYLSENPKMIPSWSI